MQICVIAFQLTLVSVGTPASNNTFYDKIQLLAGNPYRSGTAHVHHIPVGHRLPVFSVLQRRRPTGVGEQCRGQRDVRQQLVYGQRSGAACVADVHNAGAAADCGGVGVFCGQFEDIFVGEFQAVVLIRCLEMGD